MIHSRRWNAFRGGEIAVHAMYVTGSLTIARCPRASRMRGREVNRLSGGDGKACSS